jgi:hypothetical protein
MNAEYKYVKKYDQMRFINSVGLFIIDRLSQTLFRRGNSASRISEAFIRVKSMNIRRIPDKHDFLVPRGRLRVFPSVGAPYDAC